MIEKVIDEYEKAVLVLGNELPNEDESEMERLLILAEAVIGHETGG